MDLDEKGKICNEDGEMDVNECYSNRRFSENSRLVKNIGKVVLDLRSLGFTSMAEDDYASAIFLLLKVVPLQFLHALLVYLGDSVSYEASGMQTVRVASGMQTVRVASINIAERTNPNNDSNTNYRRV